MVASLLTTLLQWVALAAIGLAAYAGVSWLVLVYAGARRPNTGVADDALLALTAPFLAAVLLAVYARHVR